MPYDHFAVIGVRFVLDERTRSPRTSPLTPATLLPPPPCAVCGTSPEAQGRREPHSLHSLERRG